VLVFLEEKQLPIMLMKKNSYAERRKRIDDKHNEGVIKRRNWSPPHGDPTSSEAKTTRIK